MSKLVYISHTYKTVDKSYSAALYALRKGYIPIDPFLTLPPPVLDIIGLNENERLELDFKLLDKCGELWVFGEITKGVKAEIEWWESRGDTVRYINWSELNE